MKKFSLFSDNAYFGAANGFSGFRHNFDRIFSPEHFSRIFILKGGPGTGKSSFMQAYAEYFHKNAGVDAILCSSDSDSLDGVIINYLGKRFAIIDGTAPHEIGSKIPGARDEIINLGISWDEEQLVDHTDSIIAISSEKRAHYKRAYEALRIAGAVSDIVSGIARESFEIQEAARHAQILISGEKSVDEPKCGLMLSAFNKNGKETIQNEYRKDILKIGGKQENVSIFMQAIYSELLKRGCSVIRYASPFNDSLTDTIETGDMILTASDTDGEINADAFEKKNSKLSEKRYTELKSIEEKALLLARESFGFASDAHKALEDIYTSAMDFSKNDTILDSVIERTEKIAKK